VNNRKIYESIMYGIPG